MVSGMMLLYYVVVKSKKSMKNVIFVCIMQILFL